jgi:hypothetical protein
VMGFLNEYAGLMAEFSEEELTHAKASIMRSHAFRSFPTPAECLKACELARKELSPLWGEDARRRIGQQNSIEDLDELWKLEIEPKRHRVSKGTFDGVKYRMNEKAKEILARTYQRIGGG